MKQLIITLFVLLASLWVKAQDGTGAQSAEPTGLRADGKIYVVLVIVVTILAGLFLYLIRLDRKVTVPLVLQSLREHMEIVMACKARNPEAAAAAMQSHLRLSI